MQIHVVVEPAGGAGFVARTGAPFDWTAEGATAAEAVDKLRQRAAAAAVVTLDVPDGTNPWLAVIGSAKDIQGDPIWQAYLDGVAAYRDAVDADEDRP